MRYKNFSTRQSELDRLRAQGWRVVTFKAAPVVVAYHSMAGKVHAKGWRGKADKPSFYYSFRDESRVRIYVDQFVSNIASHYARKGERLAARKAAKASDHFSVGDVVYNSWGYDQTNIDFYQVVELKAKSVVLRAVKQNSSDQPGGPYGGHTQPRRNEFCGEPFQKLVGERGWISFEHGAGSKWDGKPMYTSSYH